MFKKVSPNLKFFLGSFFVSLPFWWGTNVAQKNLEDFLFWSQIAKNPQIFSAQIVPEKKLIFSKPVRNWQVENLKIEAKSGISLLVDLQGNQEILFDKDSDEKLPIASLTKLMTAYVVLEYYDLSGKITISKLAANQYGDIKRLEEGRTFHAEYLLYPLLMESSNGAAFALANDYGEMTERGFVELMNWEAEKIGLNDTFYDNFTGLDPQESKTEMNYSTANDLAKLTKSLLEKPLIWEILSLPSYSLNGLELVNTNRFLFEEDKSSSLAFTEAQALDDFTNWQEKIIGGKTGYTAEAGGCLLLVIKAPKSQNFLINIILGADGTENRFEEMKKLINWVNEAYKW